VTNDGGSNSPVSIPDNATGAITTKAALLIAGVLLIVGFSGSLKNQFVWDDDRQIVANYLIQDPQYFVTALRSDVWAFRAERAGAASNYWRPATVLLMIVQYGLFGKEPLGWHVVSLVGHAVNVIFVYFIVRWLTRNRDAAAVGAWLFAVHPVHVESVVWPSASVDIQMCLGVLPALLIYLKERPAFRIGPMACAGALYSFAMFSKETSIFFPALVAGVEWYASRSEGAATGVRFRRAIVASLPFVLVVAIYLGLRLFVVQISVRSAPQQMGLREFAAFVPGALAFYLRQSVFPVFLSPIHSLRAAAAGSVSIWLWGSPVAVAAVAIAVNRMWKRGAVDALATLVFLLPLGLAIWGGRGFPPDERVHDRYLYLPVFGVILFVVVRFAGKGRALLIGGGAVSVAFAAMCAAYGREWKSNATLWECAVRRAPNAPVGYVHLIDEYRDAGRLAESRGLAERALAIDPNHIETILAAGMVASEMGELSEAEKKFRAILDFDKRFQVAADQLAQVYVKQQRYGEAIAVFEEAQRSFPLLKVKYATNIAVVAFMSGQLPRAVAELESVRDELDTQPDRNFRRFHMNLGELYVRLGRTEDAVKAYRHFIEITEEADDGPTLAARRQAFAILDELSRPK